MFRLVAPIVPFPLIKKYLGWAPDILLRDGMVITCLLIYVKYQGEVGLHFQRHGAGNEEQGVGPGDRDVAIDPHLYVLY